MKASELIKLLEEKMSKHGDAEVKHLDSWACDILDVLSVSFSEEDNLIFLELE